MLQYSSDPQQQQQLSTEVVLEIDAILTRQQMQLFPTAVDEHLQQMEEASKEEEEARSFSATWNFSHIANKVIAARRQVRSDRSSRRLSSSKSLASLAPQDDQDRLRHSQESLNADVELESTASVLSRAQELATKCMQSIVTVASSLSEDTLPSYPGADLSSAATVLGFELKTVAGSGKLSHRHAQSLADAASHQRYATTLPALSTCHPAHRTTPLHVYVACFSFCASTCASSAKSKRPVAAGPWSRPLRRLFRPSLLPVDSAAALLMRYPHPKQ